MNFPRYRLRVACAALWCLGSLSLVHAGEVPITYKGAKFTTATLPRDLPAGPREVIRIWADWCAEARYRIDFDGQGRLAVLSVADSSHGAQALKVISKVETWFDLTLPPPTRLAAPPEPNSEPEAPPPTAPGIPEDPEGPPPGAPPPSAPKTAAKAPAPKSFGSGSMTPDTETGALLLLHDEEDQKLALEYLAKREPYLRSWVDEALKQTGFTLEQPLCGGFVLNASGQEEWSLNHEIVSRTEQVLALRRFGQLPFWITQGLGYEAQMAYDGLIYCFPFRDSFVGVGEHGSWPSDVRHLLRDRGAKVLTLDEVTTWKRATYHDASAKLAYGVCHALAIGPAGKLSAFLEELRWTRNKDDRRPTSGGKWERIPGFEVPAETQFGLMKKHFGPDVLKKATATMLAGKDAPPAK